LPYLYWGKGRREKKPLICQIEGGTRRDHGETLEEEVAPDGAIIREKKDFKSGGMKIKQRKKREISLRICLDIEGELAPRHIVLRNKGQKRFNSFSMAG